MTLNKTKQSTNIYVLELEDNKYYVGKTDDVDKRFYFHFFGNGSEWTKIYKPIKIFKTFPQTSEFDEYNETLRWMRLKGIENVRGSLYCQIDLTKEDEQNIKRNLRAISDQCYYCGSKGHYTKECQKKEFPETKKKVFQKNACSRCGRMGHWIDRCFAKRDIYGDDLNSFDEEGEEEEEDMEEIEKWGKSKKVFQQKSCFRCGRTGHWINDCFAKTDVRGNYLPSK